MKRSVSFFWILVAASGIIGTVPGLAAEAKPEQKLYEARGRRDPFVQLISLTARQSAGLVGVESASEIMVEGIVYDPKNGSIVVANGSVLKEGEEVGNVRVVKIQSDGAVFAVNGIEDFRSMYQEDTKKKT